MLIILLVHKKSGAISWNIVELAACVSGVEHLFQAFKSSIDFDTAAAEYLNTETLRLRTFEASVSFVQFIGHQFNRTSNVLLTTKTST